MAKVNQERKKLGPLSEISGTPEEVLEQVKVFYNSLGKNGRKKFRNLMGITDINSLNEIVLMQFLKSKVVRNFFKNRKIEVKV